MFFRIIVVFLFFPYLTKAQTYSERVKDFRQKYSESVIKEFPNSELSFYPINYKYNVTAKYKLKKNGKIITFPTTSEKLKEYKEYAEIRFKINGKKQKLMVYQPQPVQPLYKNNLFLPIKDLSAPSETYGGGRYLELNIKDFVNGEIQVDFNKLYNPYCVFSDGWSCPIPPKRNHLNIKVEAGEKIPLKTEFDHE